MNQSRNTSTRRLALPILLATFLLPALAFAADTGPMSARPDDMASMQRMQGKRCPMMMGRGQGMGHMLRMPRLPPGNEKLQLQMEGEIMQKIGEIQSKYAGQLP